MTGLRADSPSPPRDPVEVPRRGPRFRRNPGLALLLGIIFLVGVKVWVWGNLFGRTLGQAPRVFRTTTASAQTGRKAGDKKPPEAKPAPEDAEGKRPPTEKAAQSKPDRAASENPKEPGQGEPARKKPSSATDLALIQALRAKEAELRRRELRLKQQEGRLDRLRRDIERKVGELRSIQDKVESFVVQGKKLSERRLKRLAKVYESSPPEKAGLLLSRLDPSLAALILLRMDGRKAGRIWGFVNQARAVRISREMTKLR